MQIIGKTGSGVIVSMTDDEVAKAAGYSCTYDDGWRKALREAGNYENRAPVIGMKIEVRAAYDFHARINANEEKAKEAAGTLRTIANLMDCVMPSVVIPPAIDAQPVAEAE